MKITIYGSGVHICPLGLSEHEKAVLLDLERIKHEPAARLMGDVFLMSRIGLGWIHEKLAPTEAEVVLDRQLRFELRYGRKRRAFGKDDIEGNGWLLPPFRVLSTNLNPTIGDFRVDYFVGLAATIELPEDFDPMDLEIIIDEGRKAWILEREGRYKHISFPEPTVRRRQFLLEEPCVP